MPEGLTPNRKARSPPRCRKRALSGGSGVPPVALELQLIRPHACDSRDVAGDLAGCVDRVRAPDVATEVGDAVVDSDIDVTEVVGGAGIQLRVDGVRQD